MNRILIRLREFNTTDIFPVMCIQPPTSIFQLLLISSIPLLKSTTPCPTLPLLRVSRTSSLAVNFVSISNKTLQYLRAMSRLRFYAVSPEKCFSDEIGRGDQQRQ